MSSGYIAFFDETGDHGLDKINPQYPIFLLSCCVFEFSRYASEDCSRFLRLKYKSFGHDGVVFHSYKIRKQYEEFRILTDPVVRVSVMDGIADLFNTLTGTLIAGAIDKLRLRERYQSPDNPYDLAMTFCLERLYAHLRPLGAVRAPTVCVFECRGREEDRDLELVFRRVCAGANRWGPLPFEIVFVEKKANVLGLQLADLAAYPIAQHVMRPARANPAFDVLRGKLRHDAHGNVAGYGLKVFP